MPGPLEPGPQPFSPTVHNRTKPEAAEFAERNRTGSDWFKHDPKNAGPSAPAPVRLATQNAAEIAQKNKGTGSEWFQHKSGPKTEAPPANANENGNQKRIHSQEAKVNSEKIKGKEEQWYKMEDNKEYFSPRPKSRLTTQDAEEFKEKGKGSADSWYKHDQKKSDKVTPVKQSNVSPEQTPDSKKNKAKGQGMPDWYKYDKSPDQKGQTPTKAHARLTTAEGEEYMNRNQYGSAKDWFGHDPTPTKQGCGTPRITSSEGQANAKKWQDASGNWYKHDGSKGYVDASPNPRCRSELAREMLEKSHGGEMQKIMKFNKGGGDADNVKVAKVKPEARENAKKNVEGMMDKYLNEAGNKDYQSARPEPRVKPEGKQMADRNKGVIDDVMNGYLDSPAGHHQRRVRPEAEANAARHKGSVNQVMGQSGSPGVVESPRHGGRGVTSEGKEYAERNKGSIGDVISGCARMEVTGKPVPRLKTAEAEANAARHQGSMGGIFHMQGY